VNTYRNYDYLGGKDDFAVDRELTAELREIFCECPGPPAQQS